MLKLLKIHQSILEILRLCCTPSVRYVLKRAERADFSTISTFVNLLMGLQLGDGG